MTSKILISGSSGLVGSTLVDYFSSFNQNIRRLVRRKPAKNEIFWDPDNNILDQSAIENFDLIIHLGGENISGHRWTKGFKEKIKNSRVNSTRLLASAISRLKNPPKKFICASATGYYGNRFDEELTETSKAGNSFLSDVVSQWEDAANQALAAGINTVFLRFGVILSPTHGALKKMFPIFKAGLGGVIGSGKQYMPWISIDEIPRIIDFIKNNQDLNGPVNITSPQPVTNEYFTHTLADILKRPAVFRVPKFILKFTLGEMAEELLLSSTRIVPQKLINAQYHFQYPDLANTLQTLIQKI